MSRENTEQQLRKQINDLQNQIFDLQTFYLENTRDSGNLLKGFDNYLNARAPRNQLNKKPKIENIERLFSLTSIRSKTSQAFDEAFLGQKHDSNQVLPKRSRIRNNNKAKGYNLNDAESVENNSNSGDNMYSMDESSNNNTGNKGRKKKSRIPIGGKGTLENYYYIGMGRFRDWVDRQIGRTKASPLWRLFLTGLRGQMDAKNPKPYNFYIKILSAGGSILIAYYFLLFRKVEMDIQGHNILVPDYVYRVREENYIYWQTVRIAKGMPTFLTFYKWDQNLMFEVDRSGKQTPFQAHKGLQNPLTFQSPLHEYNFPATPEKHSRILMYLKNMDNPYNLYNYLRAKPITLGDWLRAGYYFVYRELGLSNRWRYDEYVRKPDIYYRLEKIRLAFRLDRDRDALYDTMDQLMKQIRAQDVLTFLVWFL